MEVKVKCWGGRGWGGCNRAHLHQNKDVCLTSGLVVISFNNRTRMSDNEKKKLSELCWGRLGLTGPDWRTKERWSSHHESCLVSTQTGSVTLFSHVRLLGSSDVLFFLNDPTCCNLQHQTLQARQKEVPLRFSSNVLLQFETAATFKMWCNSSYIYNYTAGVTVVPSWPWV